MTGAVAAGHPQTVEAAAHVLREGGNAFDAIVAAGFAASLAEPGFTSLGGGGFLLAHPVNDAPLLLDFFVDTPGLGAPGGDLEPHFFPVTVRFPASEQVFNAGLGSVAVPGVLAGLLRAHELLGRLTLAQVVAPAVSLAREGVVVSELQSYVLGLLLPILSLTDDGRRLYAPGGRAPAPGDRLRNPELADLLERLPDDRGRDFYEGAVAARLEAEMAAGRGLLTAEDLAGYRALEREPLAFDYRGHRLLTNPMPSLGGSLVAYGLELLADAELPRLARGGPEHRTALAEVLVAMEARKLASGGPAFSRGTTHASVADADGNVASMTTSNGEGSGYVAPGTGIMLNNMLGEDDLHPDGFHASPPGERVASMMSPCVVRGEQGVRLVLGSGGSKRIRTAVLQVASDVVDFDTGVGEAVAAPRMHFDGELLQLEPGLDDAAIAALAQRWPLNRWPERNLYFGGVHAVAPGAEAAAAGDPRRGGAAASGASTRAR